MFASFVFVNPFTLTVVEATWGLRNLGREWGHINLGSHFQPDLPCSRLQWKHDGTRWRTGGELKGKLANGVGSEYPSHYLGTWCIQHYYCWCAHLGCAISRLNWRPPAIKMDSSVLPKDEIWFLRVCHHISTGLYWKWTGNIIFYDKLKDHSCTTSCC